MIHLSLAHAETSGRERGGAMLCVFTSGAGSCSGMVLGAGAWAASRGNPGRAVPAGLPSPAALRGSRGHGGGTLARGTCEPWTPLTHSHRPLRLGFGGLHHLSSACAFRKALMGN